MTSENKNNLQETLLNTFRKSKIMITVFLINGVKLQGIVTWFDHYAILLKRDNQMQMIYKHAISTVIPNESVKLYDEEDQKTL